MINNLPPGCTVNMIPGCREEDIRHTQTVDELIGELQDLIDHYQQEHEIITSEDIKDALDAVKPA